MNFKTSQYGIQNSISQAMFICYPMIYDMTMLALASYMNILTEWKYPVYNMGKGDNSQWKSNTFVFGTGTGFYETMNLVNYLSICNTNIQFWYKNVFQIIEFRQKVELVGF
jgi:hypothetical protein